MDDIGLTVAALLASGAAEGIGAYASERAVRLLGGLYSAVRSKVCDGAEGIDAFDQATTAPTEERLVALAAAIDDCLHADDGLRRTVETVIEALAADEAAGRFVAEVREGARVGKVVNIGRVVGDVAF